MSEIQSVFVKIGFTGKICIDFYDQHQMDFYSSLPSCTEQHHADWLCKCQSKTSQSFGRNSTIFLKSFSALKQNKKEWLFLTSKGICIKQKNEDEEGGGKKEQDNFGITILRCVISD